MKKQILSTLAFSAIILGSVSFANAGQIRSYAELTPLQQQKYNSLSEQEKANTKAIFGFKVYDKQITVSNSNGSSFIVPDDGSTARRDGLRKWNTK